MIFQVGNRELEFRYRSGTWVPRILSAFLVLTGFALLFAATALVLDGEITSLATGLAGVGVFFAAGGRLTWLFTSDKTLFPPARVYFDNAAARFVIEEEDGRRASLPFSELEGFHVRKVRRGTSRSDGTTYWVVFLRRKDGAYWDLAYHRDERRAKDEAERLSQRVDLGATAPSREDEAPPPDDLGGIAVTRKATAFALDWRGHGSFSYAAASVAALTGFVTVLVAFVASHWSDQDALTAVIAAVIFLLGLVPVYSIVTTLGSRHRLEVGGGEVKYLTRKWPAVAYRLRRALPAASVSHVRFCYDIFDSNLVQGLALVLLDEASAERLRQLESREVDISNLWENIAAAFALARASLTLRFPCIKAADVLAAERALERAIRSAGGKAA